MNLASIVSLLAVCGTVGQTGEKIDMQNKSRNVEARVVLTAKDTSSLLTDQKPLTFREDFTSASPAAVRLDDSQTFQTIEGFGGAFTEAAAYTLAQLSRDRRAEAIRAYFDPQKGHGYTLCRTHINSCDFSLGNYAYCEVDGDVELKHFDISRDKRWLLPLIKDAMAVAGKDLRIFASPWSPPAWMKTNGEMNHGGQLKRELYPTWANYFAKYIKSYAAEGVKIWGVSVQNEPAATQTWDSCIYSAEEERDFVRDHLGPILAAQGLGDVKIIVWDHNKDIIFERAQPILSDPAAAKYVWGVGFHWYSGDEFENLDKVHKAFPNTKLLFTEGCQEGGVHLGVWDVGERYGHDIIGDLNHWTVGWVDWNLVLNERGGPNHVDNLCDAPIIADTVRNELHYRTSYYYLGHFSRFIRPGAVRIGCKTTDARLECTAFRNTDGSTALVVMNRTDETARFDVTRGKTDGAATSIPPHAIMTIIVPKG